MLNLSVLDELLLLRLSFFGLPWLGSAAILPFLAGQPTNVSFSLFVWIFIAFFTARIAGMSFNRLVDRKIDAANPRTKNRAIQRGAISPAATAGLTFISIALFILACGMINPLVLKMSPIAISSVLIYSYTKRWTQLCHLVLGFVHFLNPVFVWVALTGELSIAPCFLGLAAACLITGSDILYALDDCEFDRSYGIKSIPAKRGEETGIQLAKFFHLLSVANLAALGIYLNLNFIYFLGVTFVGAATFLTYRQLAFRRSQSTTLWVRFNNLSSFSVLFFALGAWLWDVIF